MKSDEFSGKMLDDHIEVFCYCNFDYYRNLFWCFCINQMIISKNPQFTGISARQQLEFTTHLLLTD